MLSQNIEKINKKHKPLYDKELDEFTPISQPVEINKGRNLKKYPLPDQFSLSKYELSIHRIKIHVNHDRFRDPIYHLLVGRYGNPSIPEPEKTQNGNLERIYEFNDPTSESLLLVYYPEIFGFNLTLVEASEETLRFIKDALLQVIGANVIDRYVTLSQLEIALDLHPVNVTDLGCVERVSLDGMTLRYGRHGSFGVFYDPKTSTKTTYFANDGDIRKGKNGVRVYKRDNAYVRIELQLNRPFLKEQNLTLSDLPLAPHSFDVFEFIRYRKKLDDMEWTKITRAAIKKHKKNNMHSPEAIREKELARTRMKLMGFWMHHRDIDELTVSEQIDVFKEAKKTFGLTNQTDQMFPLDYEKWGMIQRDIQNGFIRRKY